MMQVRVNVVEDKSCGDLFRVDLPTYSMVGGSEVYVKERLASVIVEVPNNECDIHKKFDETVFRKKYKKDVIWDKEGILGNVVYGAGV